MITGDYPETARNIAAQIGLSPRTEIITGSELEKMQDEELKKRIGNVNIFARVLPEHKLRIVNALKANGEIVAMTGDGVNDAPALKSAHIGIAMGARGTDVAREASALVLLDDDFSSIVKAVRLGRRIFENIKKAIAYIFAVHVPIAGMSLIPVLFKWPMMLLPVHIVFLELIIDPACSIVFEAEAEEPDSMEKPPRDPKKPLFSKNVVELSILQGLSVLLVLSFIFVVILCKGYGELEARTMTFTTLILANLGLIFVNRSWSTTTLKTLRTPNAALWWVVGGTLFFLGMALYVPFLQGIFHFTPLHYIDLAICLFASMISLFWFEVFKIKSGKKTQSK
jgi:Ca2+-transporting ATPase